MKPSKEEKARRRNYRRLLVNIKQSRGSHRRWGLLGDWRVFGSFIVPKGLKCSVRWMLGNAKPFISGWKET